MKITIDLDDQGNVTLSGEDFNTLVRQAARRKLERARVYVGTEPWFQAPPPVFKREPRIYTYNIASHSTRAHYRVLIITDPDTRRIKNISCSCPDYMYKTGRGVLGYECKHGPDARREHRALGLMAS